MEDEQSLIKVDDDDLRAALTLREEIQGARVFTCRWPDCGARVKVPHEGHDSLPAVDIHAPECPLYRLGDSGVVTDARNKAWASLESYVSTEEARLFKLVERIELQRAEVDRFVGDD